MADVRTPELVINKLTKQQYENIPTPDPNQLYLVPEDEEHKPICYPTTASEIGTTSMVVKSSVSDNGKIITERGFVYDTTPSPIITGNKLICDVGSGMVDGKLDNLLRNTEYHIRSYGVNGSGISYGSELVQRTTDSPIPVEYQLVEYLQSSGAQYINTDFKPTIDSEIEIKMRYSTSTNAYCYFGVQDTSNIKSFKGYFYNSTNYRFGNVPVSAIQTIETDYIVIFNRNGVVINSVGFQISGYTSFPDGTLNLYLFANNINNVASQFAIGRIYSAFIRDGGTVVRSLYPVYRIADNKPGMYDIVNNVFYTNQGTGEFIVGPDKPWSE